MGRRATAVEKTKGFVGQGKIGLARRINAGTDSHLDSIIGQDRVSQNLGVSSANARLAYRGKQNYSKGTLSGLNNMRTAYNTSKGRSDVGAVGGAINTTNKLRTGRIRQDLGRSASIGNVASRLGAEQNRQLEHDALMSEQRNALRSNVLGTVLGGAAAKYSGNMSKERLAANRKAYDTALKDNPNLSWEQFSNTSAFQDAGWLEQYSGAGFGLFPGG